MIIPPWEKIIETKKCRISWQDFFVTDKDLEFYDKISPIFWDKKYGIPSPALCPEERNRRRMVFRNERKLYKRQCDLSGKEIISVYSPEWPYKVYEQGEWWSDRWSPMSYGKIFDFNSTFFEQIHMLSRAVPHPNLLTINNINSPYAQYTGESKNIYMGADVWKCEDAFYSTTIKEVKNCLDLYEVEFAELCSECTLRKNLHTCHWAVRSFDCQNCDFVFNCKQCNNCLFCWWLRNKEYHIYNKPVSREQFMQTRNKLFETQSNIDKTLQEFSRIFSHWIIKENWNINCEKCVWDDLKDCKDCVMTFDAVGCENCRYCITTYHNKNCMDTTIFNQESEWTIEGVCGWVKLYSCGYNYGSLYLSDGWYTWGCMNSNNTFWCVGLHSHEHHCILNKSYSTQEYETLCGKIVDHMRSTGEWGEFFPHELSPFWYNETVANEYFPMTESEVRAKGWNWHTEDTRSFEGTAYTPLPIREYDERVVGFETAQKNIDAVLAGTIRCEVTKKPFKIIKQELAFYIENWIPIPTKHPDQRHKERMDLRNPRTLYERTCSECGKDIVTTYAPERPEKVVCEECYRKLIY